MASEPNGDWLPTTERVCLILVLLLISFVAAAGNALVLAIAYRSSSMRTANNYFIFNLAICDVVVGCFSIPIMITTMSFKRWVFGDILCNIGAFLDNLVMMQSTWTLAALSAFRALSVTNPLRFKQRSIRKNVLMLLGLQWCFASIIVAAPMYGWNEYVVSYLTFNCGSNVGDGFDRYFFLAVIILVLFIPCFIVITSYIIILTTALSNFPIDPTQEQRRFLCWRLPMRRRRMIGSVNRVERVVPNKKPRVQNGDDGHRKSTVSQPFSPQINKTSRLDKTKNKMTMKFKSLNNRSAKSSIRVLIIVGVFLSCVGPLLGISFSMWLGTGPHLSFLTLFIVYIIYLSHSALNPCIYGLFDLRFRKAYREMFYKSKDRFNFNNNTINKSCMLTSVGDITKYPTGLAENGVTSNEVIFSPSTRSDPSPELRHIT